MSEEWKTLAAQIAELKRQLADVTRERDQYKAQCELADALRNRDLARRVRPVLTPPYRGPDVTDQVQFVDHGPLVKFTKG